MASSLPDFIERRLFARNIVIARVKLAHGAIGELIGRTRDISDSGVFVEVFPVPKLPNGSHVKMHMLDSVHPDIAFNMKVVRSASNGLGLRFIDYEVAGERFAMESLRDLLRRS